MSNIIDTLKAREAASESTARENYAKLVQRVAAGESVKADDALEILRGAGRSAPEFEAHVELARRVNEKRKRASEMNADTLAEEHRAAIERSHAVYAECRQLEEEEIPRRKREADLAERLAQSRLAQGARVQREVAQAQAEFDAALNGTPTTKPEPTAAPRASFSSTPGQGPLDPWAHDVHLGEDGKAHYVPKNRPLG